jgi:iron complex outermembrane recepter protein
LFKKFVALAFLSAAGTSALQAQDSPRPGPSLAPNMGNVPADAEESSDEIVVTGQRVRGAVIGDIKPDVQLNAGDVRAFGVSSISELLSEISPQTSSGRGRGGDAPVVLLNGRRISGFAEIRDLPTEAVARVEVFPEELALKYGYRADQKVVNIVLRRRFRAITAEVAPTFATDGGRQSGRAEVNILRINTAGRTTLNAQGQHDSPLFEDERDIASSTAAGGFDQRPFRTLLSRANRFALNGTVNRMILNDVSTTLNGQIQATNSQSRLGASVPVGAASPTALLRNSDGMTGHVGIGLNGRLKAWQWNFTSNYDLNRSVSLTDRGLPLRDRVRTTTHGSNSQLILSGALFKLPAGDVSTSVKAGLELIKLDGTSSRAGLVQSRSLGRSDANVQASFDLPIASRRSGILQPLGNLSANFNAAANRVSDFGTLTTLGAGLTWSPVVPLELIASFTDEEGAPTTTQLGNPQSTTPNVQLFDFVRQTTVTVNRVDGGNPGLVADNRRVFKVGLTFKPIKDTDLSLSANYTNSRTRNLISSFPTPTAAIEAAFADRFSRDGAGRLISFDNRPVNFARAKQEQLRWGFTFSKRLGPAPAPGSFDALRGQGGGQGGGGGRPPEGAPAGGQRDRSRDGGSGAGGGGRGFGGGGGRAPRVQLALYHSWVFRDDILIRSGVPLLDLLNGAAVGSNGGRPKHDVELQSGFSKNGIGVRLNGKWESGTLVRGAANPLGGTSGDLSFSSNATLGLRLFADLGLQRALAKENPWVRGLRISIAVDNLFNSRPTVRDTNGITPITYQPDYLDPLGRTVRITLRKVFF